MSEGYNAGLPARLTHLQPVPEQMSKAVPHLAQELMSSQEIITDIAGRRAQKDAAAYLNRQEAGEVGLGREVPMQKGDLMSPYGRELRYQGDTQGRYQDGQRGTGGKGNYHAAASYRPEERPLTSSDRKSAGNKVQGEDHQDLERIPTEAESDNEPFPDDAMSIPSQVNPAEAVAVAKPAGMQKNEPSTKEQESNKVSHEEEARLGDVSRFGHAAGKGDQERERESHRKEDSRQDSKPHGSLQQANVKQGDFPTRGKSQEILQSHDALHGNGDSSKVSSSSQYANRPPNGPENGVMQAKGQGQNEYGESPAERNGNSASQGLKLQNSKDMKGFREHSVKNPGTGLYGENAGNAGFKGKKVAEENMRDAARYSNAMNDVGYKQETQHMPTDKERLNENRGKNFQEKDAKFVEKNDHFRGNEDNEKLSKGESSWTGQRDANNREYYHDINREDPCKHCDIYPEVSYKLESSDAEAGPLKCKGCGPNPKFTPVVEKLGLNMSVNDKLVSPKEPQTMKPVPLPQTKGDISGKFYHDINREDPCKHCDISPEVSYKLESSDAQAGPLKCKGCGPNPNFTPVLEKLGLNVSVNDKLKYPQEPQTMKPVPLPQTKGEISGKGGQLRPNAGIEGAEYHGSLQQSASHENNALREHGPSRDQSSSHDKSSSFEQGPTREGLSHDQSASRDQGASRDQSRSRGQGNDLKSQNELYQHHASRMNEPGGNYIENDHDKLTMSQNSNTLLKDAANGEAVMKFAKNREDESSSQRHNSEERESKFKDAKETNKNHDEENSPSNSHSSQFKGDKYPGPSQETSTAESPEPAAANIPSQESIKELSDGKEKNITTLVEIISKGMRALRESNFDIGTNGKLRAGSKENEGPKNGAESVERQEKERNDEKEHGKQGQDGDSRVKPIKAKDGSTSAALDSLKPGTFPVAVKPEQIVSQMHGGKHGSNDVPGDNVRNTGPEGERFKEKGRADADGNFSDDSLPKHAWHKAKCADNPELCKADGSSTQIGGRLKGNENKPDKMSLQKPSNDHKPNPECAAFFSLPDRQKRKLPQHKLARYKKNCLPHHQSDLEPLNVEDIKNDDTGLGGGSKTNNALISTGQKTSNLDKINLSAAKLKIASLLSQETPEKTAPPGFHPGYTTMAFAHGAAMPDTAETFVSKTGRPDFSSLAGESGGKSSDMSYYFNQKNDQKEKDMLMRAVPEPNGGQTDINNGYGK